MTTVLLFFWINVLLREKCYGSESLYKPDFESPWTPLRSQDPALANIEILHGLGEVPALVDVQVKTLEDPNKDFIFPAVGGSPRDDDNMEFYGGVIYLYNEEEVLISSPLMANNFATGSAVYTTNDTYFAGPNNQTSHDVLVRVRAWRTETLPSPDFSSTDILVKAGSTEVDEVFREVEHGLGEYPGLVRVRARLRDGFKIGYRSDAVGRIFEGGDGYGIPTKSSYASLEMYVWKKATVPAWIEESVQLGPNVANENFEIPLVGTSTDMYVQAWAEALSGDNAGYRFPGSGALVYSEKTLNPVCTYGGLVYGYSRDMVRFWRPTDAANGGIICISSLFGLGTYTQISVDAKAMVSVWTLGIKVDVDVTTTVLATTESTTTSGKETTTGGGGTAGPLGDPLEEWKDIENVCIHIRK